jgi:hypothetical protein
MDVITENERWAALRSSDACITGHEWDDILVELVHVRPLERLTWYSFAVVDIVVAMALMLVLHSGGKSSVCRSLMAVSR